MEPSTPKEIELTEDLIDYIRRSTIQVASKWDSKRIEFDEVVQHVMLNLVSRPPKFDASRGATLKTFIYFIIKRIVLGYLDSMESKLGQRHSLDAKVHDEGYRLRIRDFDQPRFLDYIDDEDSRRLILLMLEHDNNVSKVARRIGVTEGTIRNRLKMLRAKLNAAGFNPFAEAK